VAHDFAGMNGLRSADAAAKYKKQEKLRKITGTLWLLLCGLSCHLNPSCASHQILHSLNHCLNMFAERWISMSSTMLAWI
jgi:hypothetical protein